MPDDRPGDRLLTYAELGELLGISPDGARTKAKRAGWQVIPGNDGRARVRVAMAELPERSPEQDRSRPERQTGQIPSMNGLETELLARAERAERSAEQARAEAEQARATLAQREVALARVEELAIALQTAAERDIAAARAIAAAEVAAARAEVTAQERLIGELKEMLAAERRPWWRRWLD